MPAAVALALHAWLAMSDAYRSMSSRCAPHLRADGDHAVALRRKRAVLRDAELRKQSLLDELTQLCCDLRELFPASPAGAVEPAPDPLLEALWEMIEVQQQELDEAEQEIARARANLDEVPQDPHHHEQLRLSLLHRHTRPRRRLPLIHVQPR